MIHHFKRFYDSGITRLPITRGYTLSVPVALLQMPIVIICLSCLVRNDLEEDKSVLFG